MLMGSDIKDEGGLEVSSDSVLEVDIQKPGPLGIQIQPAEAKTRRSFEEELPSKVRGKNYSFGLIKI